jgi:hypothetical protein
MKKLETLKKALGDDAEVVVTQAENGVALTARTPHATFTTTGGDVGAAADAMMKLIK